MMYPNLKKDNANSCTWICWFVLFAIIILLVVPRWKRRSERFTKVNQNQAPANQNEGILPEAVRNGICHPKCCLQSQWPVSFMDNTDNVDVSKYIKTEYSCKSCENGVGCLCLSKEDFENIKR